LSAPDQRVPELVGGVDIRTLPLTAVDGFVLSRIDGRSSCSEIIAMTGLAAEQVTSILTKLAACGAIRMPAAPEPPRAAPARPGAGSSQPPRSGPPRTPYPRASVAPTSLSSQPPRRRAPSGMSPRRLFSESSISGPPPPDPRTLSTRVRNSTPSRPRTPVPDAPVRPSGRPGADHPSSLGPPRASVPVSLPPLSIPPLEALTGSMFPVSNDGGSAQPASEGPTGRTPVASPASSLTPPEVTLHSEPPLYDVRELDEACDLPLERRKQVLDLFYRLGSLDYYKVLGIAYGADKKEVRSAYFSLSKAFHPDSMFRKELGSFKAKMTTVFQALTEAYETLSKKKAREEYDAYLRSTRSVQDAERALATDDVARADINVEVPRPPLVPVTDYALPTPTPVPTPPREVSPEARRIARELIERRLRGLPQRPPSESEKGDSGRSVLPSARPSIPTPLSNLPPAAPLDRQELARQLGRTLIDVGRITGSNDKVARAVAGARAAFERGDVAASVQHMARAFSLAPERVDLHQEYERLSRMLAQRLADDYEEQAKFEAKQGKWAAAAVSWLKVCEGRPDDSAAHRAAAFALLKAGGDLRGAQKHAQRAVYLAPDDIDARILLAQAYLTVGLKLNAKRELDAAAKLDPANEMVKNLLTDLKG
jgi:curved DNA-binding protein CbpA